MSKRALNRGRALARTEGLEARVLFASFQVTTDADAGPGSLRQAILDANAAPGADMVYSSTGSVTVRPLSALPAVADPVTITGFVLDGTDAGPVPGGLVVSATAAGSSLGGLTVAHFRGPGVRISAPDVTVTGVDVRQNEGAGVLVEGAGAAATIASSRIGTDAATTADLGNGGDGARATGGASVALTDSLVGFNDGVGVAADGFGSSLALDNSKSLRNGSHGVAATGGATASFTGRRLLAAFPADPLSTYRFNGIHHNGGSGLYVEGPADGLPRPSSSASVAATDISDNAGDGVTLVNADGVRMEPGLTSYSTISHNGGNGVTVRGRSERNDLSDADIDGNAGLAIDLGGDGPTPNDPGDADAGPNTLQNAPVITSATWVDDRAFVRGTLNSTPNTTVVLRFFTDKSTSRPDANGEGGYFVNETRVTTGSDGNASFAVRLEPIPSNFPGHGFPGVQGRSAPSVGATIRATATAAGNTSEFSNGALLTGRVTTLHLNGVTWGQPFRNALEAAGVGSSQYGYALATYTPDGAETRRPPAVWSGIDIISMQFPRGAHVTSSSLRVTGLRGPYAVTNFGSSSDSATWRLDRPIEFDRVTVSLVGVPGIDYRTTFQVTPGDADRTGRVNALDLALVRSKLNTSPGPASGYTTAADVNASGTINSLDLVTVRRAVATQPSGWPPPATAAIVGTTQRATASLFAERPIL